MYRVLGKPIIRIMTSTPFRNCLEKSRTGVLDLLKDMERKVNPVRDKNRRNLQNVKCSNETILKRNLESAEKKRTETAPKCR